MFEGAFFTSNSLLQSIIIWHLKRDLIDIIGIDQREDWGREVVLLPISLNKVPIIQTMKSKCNIGESTSLIDP